MALHNHFIDKPTATLKSIATVSLDASNVGKTREIIPRTTIALPNMLFALRIIPPTIKDAKPTFCKRVYKR